MNGQVSVCVCKFFVGGSTITSTTSDSKFKGKKLHKNKFIKEAVLNPLNVQNKIPILLNILKRTKMEPTIAPE